MPAIGLTKRQADILGYLRAYISEKGFSPSIVEIGQHFRLSSSATVHKYLNRLEERGHIRRAPNRSRSIQILETDDSVRVEVRGVIGARAHLQKLEPPETVTVPRGMTSGARIYALRVMGDALLDEQIRDHDLLILEERAPLDGESVITADGRWLGAVPRHAADLPSLSESPSAAENTGADARPSPDRIPVDGVLVALLRQYR
ncbi:MAG: hypothetical protein HYX75_09930 [Acidobacteria bacterium]|nr:hypothetical protein [Acidobacteriota bacterium]